jgi:threonyl-tRNA synthetase
MKSKKLHVRTRGSEDVKEIDKKKFVEHVKKLVEERSQEL